MQNDLTSQLIILYCSQMIVGSSHSSVVVGLRTPFKTMLLFTISFIGHHRPVSAGFRIVRSSAILIIVPPYRKWIEIQEVMQKKKKAERREVVQTGKGSSVNWCGLGREASSAGPLEVTPRPAAGWLGAAGSAAASAFGGECDFFCQNEEIRPALRRAFVHTPC